MRYFFISTYLKYSIVNKNCYICKYRHTKINQEFIMSLNIEEEAGQTATPNTPPNHNGNQSQFQQNAADIFSNLGWETSTAETGAEELKEIEKSLNDGSEATSLLINDAALPLPVIAVTMVSGTTAVVFTLLFEKMLKFQIEPVVDVIRDGSNNRYEIISDRPTSRCYGDRMRATITSHVKQRIANVTDVVHIHHAVVPVDASIPGTTRVYFNSALVALKSYLDKNDRGINAAFLSNNNLVVRQRTKITPNDTRLTIDGRRIAADFTTRLNLTLANVRNTNNNGEVTVQRNEVLLAETSGFVDFNITAIQPDPQQPQATLARHTPVIIFDEISSASNVGHSVEDVRTQLLGLTTAIPLADMHGYVRVFDHPQNKKSKNNIGNLGIEHDPFMRTPPVLGPVKVQSVAPGTSPKDGYMTPIEVAELWCTKGVAIALDVEQGGRLEWSQSVFVTATGVYGDASRAVSANAKIIEACDALTNGQFSVLWQQSTGNRETRVVHDAPVVVHLGTYTDKDGIVRDIRSVNYLTMLGMLPKDLEKLSQVTAAMIPGSSNKQTASDRRKALTMMLPDADITGLATRVYFAPGFIHTLASAMVSAGITYMSDEPLGYGVLDARVAMQSNLGSVINGGGLYAGAGNTNIMNGGNNYFGYVNPMFR